MEINDMFGKSESQINILNLDQFQELMELYQRSKEIIELHKRCFEQYQLANGATPAKSTIVSTLNAQPNPNYVPYSNKNPPLI